MEYREKAKEALAKNIKITNSKLSQEEIEEKIDSGDVSVFSSAIIQVYIDRLQPLKAIVLL